MKILVTGGAGFIGSHTVVELAQAGHQPVILDDFSNSTPAVLDGLARILGRPLTCYQHDVNDAAFLSDLLRSEQIEGIIHFAASKAVGESVENPLLYYQNNLSALVTLLKTMLSVGVPHLVFSSSCTVYGQPDTLPVTEETPVQPATSPYGNTKQVGEEIIRDVVTSGAALKALALRYFNPIGAHSSALIGELPLGVPSNLVPYLTQAAAGLRGPLTVFGSDYPTPDGTAIRDYIHVVDLAKAHVRAVEVLARRAESTYYDVFNLGTGRGNSVLELIETFEQTTGVKLPYTLGPRRAGDVTAVYGEVSKAKRLLGWQTEKSLAESLADAWRWQQKLAV